MPEVNLLINYPQPKRDLAQRAQTKTAQDRKIARRFGREFFDGDRKHGYGGYTYNPRFWQNVIPDFQARYNLTAGSTILDVGCAKGFMLCDFQNLIPGIRVSGIDISKYAITHALPQLKPHLQVASAQKLPFPDNSFDLVVSINTIHNLPLKACIQALKEIQRVTKKHAFITVDAYRNDAEKKRMEMWNLTAKTILSVDDWKTTFTQSGYRGDYYWFIP